jgi:uncharacterized membrane protein YphA (DoxX/SURF4 family)
MEHSGRWERWIYGACLVIGRLGLACLFFTQLFWKMPPTFGCPPDYAFTTATADGRLARTSGLCDWIGVEQVWSTRDRPWLVADTSPIGGPRLAIDIGPIARMNGWFLENVIQPNIRWMGWLVWGAEAFVVVSLFLGLFTRAGALASLAVSAQLMVGLAGISNPYEWEWGYNLMVLMSLVLLGIPSGRALGLDAVLRRATRAARERGKLLARLFYLVS